jgi:hypothetical protein
MTAFTNFDLEDIVEGNIAKNVTSTIFSGGAGSLGVNGVHTSSTQTSSAAAEYYWDIYDKNPSDAAAEVQYQIAYGHYAGSGSILPTGLTEGLTPTRAVYSQFRNLLIENPTPTTKFTMGDSANTTCDRMMFISFNRARFKEQIDVGNWSLTLSGSTEFYSHSITLIDDSSQTTGTTENGHKVYNIISGSGTTPSVNGDTSAYEYWGKIYPELGILALNGDRVAGNISNTGASAASQRSQNLYLLNGADSSGTSDHINEKMHWAIKSGSYFSGRADENVSSTHFFVRAKNSKYNFTTNETFKTGSAGQLRHASMNGDPQVYISTVGLYNDANELCAVAKLSKPLLKNFEREATIRVKLDY